MMPEFAHGDLALDDPFMQPDAASANGSGPADQATPDWGINPTTGKPYTMPPEERKARGERLAAARKAAQTAGRTPPRKATARQRTGKEPAAKGQDYRPAVGALIQLVAMPLAVAGRFWAPLTLDSWAVSRAAPDLVEVGHELLVDNPAWAATVERAAQLGPWGKAGLVLLPLALQIAANHRLVPASPDLGVLSPDEMKADMEAYAERMKAEAAA